MNTIVKEVYSLTYQKCLYEPSVQKKMIFEIDNELTFNKHLHLFLIILFEDFIIQYSYND